MAGALLLFGPHAMIVEPVDDGLGGDSELSGESVHTHGEFGCVFKKRLPENGSATFRTTLRAFSGRPAGSVP